MSTSTSVQIIFIYWNDDDKKMMDVFILFLRIQPSVTTFSYFVLSIQPRSQSNKDEIFIYDGKSHIAHIESLGWIIYL